MIHPPLRGYERAQQYFYLSRRFRWEKTSLNDMSHARVIWDITKVKKFVEFDLSRPHLTYFRDYFENFHTA